MSFFFRLVGSLAILAIVCAANVPTTTFAQTDGTPGATGQLDVHNLVCIQPDLAPGTFSIQLSDKRGTLDCQTGTSVDLLIDGQPVSAADGDTFNLAVGAHTIAETTSGASLDIEISEQATTEIDVILAIEPAATETSTPTNAPVPIGHSHAGHQSGLGRRPSLSRVHLLP